MKTLLLAASLCQYVFSIDARPVDGNFQEIKLQKDINGDYTASYHVITAGFGSPVEDKKEVLGSGLVCEESKEGKFLQSLFCSVDMRPADGELVELTLTRNENGRYDAILHKATYPTPWSEAIDETTELAYGLKYGR